MFIKGKQDAFGKPASRHMCLSGLGKALLADMQPLLAAAAEGGQTDLVQAEHQLFCSFEGPSIHMTTVKRIGDHGYRRALPYFWLPM